MNHGISQILEDITMVLIIKAILTSIFQGWRKWNEAGKAMIVDIENYIYIFIH